MRWQRLAVTATAVALVGVSGCQCGAAPDPAPADCQRDSDCAAGERCQEGRCAAPRQCESAADCAPEELCQVVDGSCRLRPGFGRECDADTACYPGFFCALGRCRDGDEALVCALASDCPLGMRCDRTHFYCIEEAPCSLADAFAEITCDPDQVCDLETDVCVRVGPGECDPQDQESSCPPDEVCDAAGRCVQCLRDEDCGPGLVCNSRAGRCESEDLCRRDADCPAPLVCDPAVSLCRVPLPACESDLDCAVSELCNHVTGTCEPRGGKCRDDWLEENDSPSGARVVEWSGTLVEYDELQLCPDDDDYFAVALARGAAFTAAVSATTAAAAAEVELVAPDGVGTLQRVMAPPQGSGILSAVIEADGTYYVRVLARMAPTPYGLRLEQAPGVACAADAQEGAAGNDTPARARPLSPGRYDGLTLCLGDLDLYRVSLGVGQAVQVQVSAAPQLDVDLRLLDADDGQTALAAATQAGGTEALFFRTLEARDVLLEASAFYGAPGTYALDVSIEPPFFCQPDLMEPAGGNGSPASATALAPEGLDAVALTLCYDDEDWWVADIDAGQRLVATVRFEPGDADLDLEFYDADMALLAASRTGWGGESVSVVAEDAAERVWLRVLSADGGECAYSLSLFVEPADACGFDDAEPNDTGPTAAPLPAEASLTLCGFDQDFFAVELSPGKTLLAQIEFDGAAADLDLQLLHPDGQTPVASSEGTGGEEQIQYLAQVQGRFLLRVFSSRSNPQVRYRLSSRVD